MMLCEINSSLAWHLSLSLFFFFFPECLVSVSDLEFCNSIRKIGGWTAELQSVMRVGNTSKCNTCHVYSCRLPA